MQGDVSRRPQGCRDRRLSACQHSVTYTVPARHHQHHRHLDVTSTEAPAAVTRVCALGWRPHAGTVPASRVAARQTAQDEAHSAVGGVAEPAGERVQRQRAQLPASFSACCTPPALELQPRAQRRRIAGAGTGSAAQHLQPIPVQRLRRPDAGAAAGHHRPGEQHSSSCRLPAGSLLGTWVRVQMPALTDAAAATAATAVAQPPTTPPQCVTESDSRLAYACAPITADAALQQEAEAAAQQGARRRLQQLPSARGGDPVPVTQAQAFSLASRPSSPIKILLDFDGHTTTGTNWNADFGVAAITTPPYSSDTDTASFSQQDLDDIYAIW